MNVSRQDRISGYRPYQRLRCQHIVLALLLCVSLHIDAGQGALTAVAASLRSVWPELLDAYTSDTGQAAPSASFGSSGLLATQIINGAPFELFLSADLASINRLPVDTLSQRAQIFALGELHLAVPTDSPWANSLSLDTLASQMRTSHTGQSARLAIANPDHAPYGMAAKQALQSSGLWPLPARQLLLAQNASQTLQFVRSGAVEAAIIPYALVSVIRQGIVSVPLDPDSYEPVEHTVAVLSGSSTSAKRFADWLLQPTAAEILEKAGLTPADKPDNP